MRRRYLAGTLVLETEFETAGGRLTLTDALAVGPDERGHELGARAIRLGRWPPPPEPPRAGA